MATITRLQPAAAREGSRGSSTSRSSNPNPSSAEYSVQRGSVDLLVRTRDGSRPISSATGARVAGGGTSADAAEAEAEAQARRPVKMSFLEIIRAQRQVKAKALRGVAQSNGTSATALTTTAPPTNPPTGGFSALASSKSSNPTTSMSAAPPASFEQVQEEIETGFQRNSRANPLGGVGTAYGEGGDDEAGQGGEDAKTKTSRGQQRQQQQQQHQTRGMTTSTSRNLKARQLMMAPTARSESVGNKNKYGNKNNNNDGDSSDEEAGRSSLGRAKKVRKG